MHVLNSLQNAPSDASSTKIQRVDAIAPVFGMRWGARKIRRVAGDRLNRILWPLGNSNPDKPIFRKIWGLRHLAIADEANPPQDGGGDVEL